MKSSASEPGLSIINLNFFKKFDTLAILHTTNAMYLIL